MRASKCANYTHILHFCILHVALSVLLNNLPATLPQLSWSLAFLCGNGGKRYAGEPIRVIKNIQVILTDTRKKRKKKPLQPNNFFFFSRVHGNKRWNDRWIFSHDFIFLNGKMHEIYCIDQSNARAHPSKIIQDILNLTQYLIKIGKKLSNFPSS